MKVKTVFIAVFLMLNAFFVHSQEMRDQMKPDFEGKVSTYWTIGFFFIGIILGLLTYYLFQKRKHNELEHTKSDIELQFRKLELNSYVLHLAKTNSLLEQLKRKIITLKEKHKSFIGYNQLIQTINRSARNDKQWEDFRIAFKAVHPDFNIKVLNQYPNITSNELRLMALIKMNLSSKDIANILNISHDGVKKARYRLRKKLKLIKDNSLERAILNL